MMKNILKKYGRLGTAGLSFVELLISMAILAVIGAAVGGAMYVSSRSYARGSAEVDVQEEAQVSANLICDWIIDATSVSVPGITGDGSGSGLVIVHPEGGESITITVSYDASTKTVNYNAVNAAGISKGSGVLASNVTGCTFFSTFNENRNVNISMDFNVNERTYHAVTDTSSRNHDFISTGGGATDAAPVIGFDIPPVAGQYYVYIEPGQNDTNGASFEFEAVVYNFDPTNTVFNFTRESGNADTSITLTPVSGTENRWKVKVQCVNQPTLPQANAEYKFTAVKTIGATVLSDTKTVKVLVREATKCEFDSENAVRDTSLPGNPNSGKSGCVYKVANLDLGLANQSRQFGAPYDSGNFGYKDPSEVQFIYRFADGTDASSYVIANETTTGTPSVQVTLAADLPKDLYVIAVATHSGSLAANTVYGNPATNANNKVTKFLTDANGGTQTNFTYGKISGHTTAYYDTLKIAGGGGGPFPQIGKGIYRGTPAFIVGKYQLNYVNNTLIPALLADSRLRNAGYNTYDDINNNNGKRITYWTTVYYLEEGTTNWKHYVIAMNDNHATDLVSDNLYVKLRCDNLGSQTGCIFKPDKGYTLKVQLDVFFNGECVYTDSSTGSVPAAIPYAWTGSGNNFSDSYYSSTNPFQIRSQNSPQLIPVYFSGCSMTIDTFRPNFRVEMQTQSGWVTAPDNVQNLISVEWNGSYSATPNKVVLNDTDHTTFNIGTNYNEDEYPASSCTLEMIKIDQNAYSNMSSGLYRIVFDTTYPMVADIAHPGTAGSSVGSLSGSTLNNTSVYHLSNTTTGSGVIYLRR